MAYSQNLRELLSRDVSENLNSWISVAKTRVSSMTNQPGSQMPIPRGIGLVITPDQIPQFIIPTLEVNDDPISNEGNFDETPTEETNRTRNLSDPGLQEIGLKTHTFELYKSDPGPLHKLGSASTLSGSSGTSPLRRRTGLANIWQQSISSLEANNPCTLEVYEDEVVTTNRDPMAALAMRLTHFKSQTCYGFDTLHTQPHTRRRESLFHQAPKERKLRKRHTSPQLNLEGISNGVTDKFIAGDRREYGRLVSPGNDRKIDDDTLECPESCSTNSTSKKHKRTLLDKLLRSIQNIRLSRKKNTSSRKVKEKDSAEIGIILLTTCFQSSSLVISYISCQDFAPREHTKEVFLRLQLLPEKKSFVYLTDAKPVSRRLFFDDLVKFSGSERHKLSQMVLSVECCTHDKDLGYRTLGEANFSLVHIVSDQECISAESLLLRDVVSQELRGLGVSRSMNALQLSVTMLNDTRELMITVDRALQISSPDDTHGAYIDMYVVQPGRAPSHAVTNVLNCQETSSTIMVNEDFTFRISLDTRDLSYTCVVITLVVQTQSGEDTVIGRVCLGELAVTEREREHWHMVLGKPGVTYTEWHELKSHL